MTAKVTYRFLFLLMLPGLGLFCGCGKPQARSGKPAGSSQTPRVESILQVGFRTTQLHYRNARGQRVARKLCVWYPTREEVTRVDYKKSSDQPASKAAVAPGKHPVVLFSHGLWSAPEFSSFLTEELACRGYIVAGVHHADAITGWGKRKQQMPKFFKPRDWDDTNHADRGEDVRAMLDHLLAEHNKEGSFLYNHVDAKAIGAMGHSMGGHTIAGLVGGWKSWHDRRVRVALLLSPYIMPYLAKRTVQRIQVPVMLQGATGDLGITPFLGAFYKRLSGPKYFLVLDRENHFSWTNLVCKGQPGHAAVRSGSPQRIVRYSAAFLDRHLRGHREAEQVLKEKATGLAKYLHRESR